MDPHSLFNSYPLEDYRAQRQEIESALHAMLEQGHYILGGEVTAFEREFADWVGVRHAMGVANGTDAIELLLRGLGIGRGDAVAVPSHTAVASISAIARAGATPVFLDVDAATYTITTDSLEAALREDSSIRAVLAVHLYGHPADVAGLQVICDQRGIVLLEDCAQAHGATWRGRKVGSLARGAAFSFYPTKNLGAIGDGGAITTDDDALAVRIREVRQYGWRERYISAVEGVNSRLDEMQAAILRVKLRTLDARNAARRKLATLYTEGLREFSLADAPAVKPGCEHAYHLYVIRSKNRDALMKHLLDAGVPVALHYPAAVHQQPAYAAVKHGSLAQTEALIPEILSLPLHPFLSDDAVRFTLEAMRKFTAA
ncbi:MAG: DegT/DnrJ/EryC1/StrS family aminotransferase [Verrucomicrobia bacterium]|nr:DegT/DnrJ/EryC1/StrS family aminotransferase [Verrucomicrobiota bacterium]